MVKKINSFQGFTGAFEGRNLPLEKTSSFVLLKQVHGKVVHLLNSEKSSREAHLQEGDALICTQKDIPVAVKTADCVPILIAHPDAVVAAVHAGWRGSRLKILEKVLLIIRDDLKKDLSKTHLAIGPAICAKCYEVGEEVAKEFEEKYLKKKENGKFLLDLKEANADLARSLGVPESQIEISEDCTLCMNEKYHSYRYESQKGLSKEGRNYSWIMLT